MLELAEMTHTVDGMQEAVKEVDNVLATYSNDKARDIIASLILHASCKKGGAYIV